MRARLLSLAVSVANLSTLGLIAGQGRFPFEVARAARARGLKVVIAALHGCADAAIAESAECTDDLEWLYLGELERLITLFQNAGVQGVIVAGKVPKTNLYGDPTPLRLDSRAMKLLAKLENREDDSIMLTLAKLLESEGLHLCSQVELVSDLLAGEGQLGQVVPTAEQARDIAFGWPIAKAIGGLDIGQTVVVGNSAVLAVEAIEGTDETIRRGGRLGMGCATVVKVAKPDQDLRFDVPAVGPDTVRVLMESGVSVLAVETGKTLLFEREEMIRLADASGIVVMGIGPEWVSSQEAGKMTVEKEP
jgi:DUF1009 family protein